MFVSGGYTNGSVHVMGYDWEIKSEPLVYIIGHLQNNYTAQEKAGNMSSFCRTSYKMIGNANAV